MSAVFRLYEDFEPKGKLPWRHPAVFARLFELLELDLTRALREIA